MAEQDKSGEGKPKEPPYPGMMGDGTEEQNLDQKGNPGARISEAEVDEAFGQKGGGNVKPAK